MNVSRGSPEQAAKGETMIFTIDTDNNITAHATAANVNDAADTLPFRSAKEFAKLATEWPAERLVEQLE